MSKQPRELDLRYAFRFRILEAFVSICNTAIPWATALGISYFLRESIGQLAGKHTLADIGIKFLVDFKITEVISYIGGAGGIIYGLREKKLRRDSVERLQNRVIELETLSDPGRSSSSLTPRGETRKEDRSR